MLGLYVREVWGRGRRGKVLVSFTEAWIPYLPPRLTFTYTFLLYPIAAQCKMQILKQRPGRQRQTTSHYDESQCDEKVKRRQKTPNTTNSVNRGEQDCHESVLLLLLESGLTVFIIVNILLYYNILIIYYSFMFILIFLSVGMFAFNFLLETATNVA